LISIDYSNELISCRWVPELLQHQPLAPIILVGTKLDLKESSPKENCVKTEDAQRLAAEIKAAKYLECSAKTQVGLKQVFDEVIF
jgi:GTPase SAR1 family protein